MDKKALMQQIRQALFAAHEATLFLDTHPEDKAALAYFHQQRENSESLMEEYTAQYGPLSVMDVNGTMDGWTWIKGPWPWEKEAN